MFVFIERTNSAFWQALWWDKQELIDNSLPIRLTDEQKMYSQQTLYCWAGFQRLHDVYKDTSVTTRIF